MNAIKVGVEGYFAGYLAYNLYRVTVDQLIVQGACSFSRDDVVSRIAFGLFTDFFIQDWGKNYALKLSSLSGKIGGILAPGIGIQVGKIIFRHYGFEVYDQSLDFTLFSFGITGYLCWQAFSSPNRIPPRRSICDRAIGIGLLVGASLLSFYRYVREDRSLFCYDEVITRIALITILYTECKLYKERREENRIKKLEAYVSGFVAMTLFLLLFRKEIDFFKKN